MSTVPGNPRDQKSFKLDARYLEMKRGLWFTATVFGLVSIALFVTKYVFHTNYFPISETLILNVGRALLISSIITVVAIILAVARSK